jgi:hypothetical protein
MRPSSKSAKALLIVFGVFALLVAWIGFQLGTHHHTGILRTLANANHFLRKASTFASVQPRTASAPSGRQHSVTLSWKASASPIVGYNVYRRGTSGVVELFGESVLRDEETSGQDDRTSYRYRPCPFETYPHLGDKNRMNSVEGFVSDISQQSSTWAVCTEKYS